jgi:phosphoribosyl-ATP pyrophosphohydrolase
MKDNLEDLVKIIRSKKNEDPTKSYTSSLMKGGIEVCIDKLEEEFDELKEALNKNSNIVHETADTIYHMLVALEVANVKFEDVLIELKKRKKQSGFKEKKNRI